MTSITPPFNPTEGFIGWIIWLADATNGWFFVLTLLVLFLIVLFPMIDKFKFDTAFLSASFGVFLLSLPLYFGGGLSERAVAMFTIILLIAIIKYTVFEE